MNYPNNRFVGLTKVPSKNNYANGQRNNLDHDAEILFPRGICLDPHYNLYELLKSKYNPYVIFAAIFDMIPKGIGQKREQLYIKSSAIKNCKKSIASIKAQPIEYIPDEIESSDYSDEGHHDSNSDCY